MSRVEATIVVEEDTKGSYLAGYLKVDGNNRFRWVTWTDQTATFEWDRKLEDFDLKEAVTSDIPSAVGITQSKRIDEIDGVRIDTELDGGTYLAVSRPGKIMNLLIATSLITPGLVEWMVKQNANPEGLDDFETIAKEISGTFRQMQSVDSR